MRLPDRTRHGIRRLVSVAVFVVIAAVTLCLSSGSDEKAAASGLPQEYEIKAAFLYNFAKFVEWPAVAFREAQSPFIVTIHGSDPFGEALQILKDKTIGGRRILVRKTTQVEQIEKCHILFISESERRMVPQILRHIRAWNVLTIGEMPGFAHFGGAINFVIEEDRVRFEINPDAARRAGLKISSQLLKLSRVVGGAE